MSLYDYTFLDNSNETGSVKHFLYNSESRKAVSKYNYCVDKYWTRNFLNFIEPITTDWVTDYSINMRDAYEWSCTLKYDDETNKIIKGNIVPPPFAEDIERRISNLAAFEVAPELFFKRE